MSPPRPDAPPVVPAVCAKAEVLSNSAASPTVSLFMVISLPARPHLVRRRFEDASKRRFQIIVPDLSVFVWTLAPSNSQGWKRRLSL
jgi:hypothetical protein